MSGTSGTIRTDSYMLANQQQDGQADGSYTLTYQRDLTVSKTNVNDIYDDPTNAQGLGAPVTIRGSVYIDRLPGLVIGTGQTTATRTTNFSLIQNAFNKAVSWNKIIYGHTGTAETYSTTGLSLPGNGSPVCYRGQGSRTVYQNFNGSAGTGCPVFTVGDITGQNYIYYPDIMGLGWMKQGNSQTGLVNSCDLAIGSCCWGKVEGFLTGNKGATVPGNPSYYGLFFVNGAPHNTQTFNCQFANGQINGAQNTIWYASVLGTGNSFDEIYVNGGGAQGFVSTTPPAVTNAMISFGTGGVMTDQSFRRVNLEWCTTPVGIIMQNVYNSGFYEMHMEGINLTGAGPRLIDAQGCTVTINGWLIETTNTQSASGTGSFIRNYQGGGSTFDIRNVTMIAYGAGVYNDLVNIPMNFISPTNERDDDQSAYEIHGMRVNDDGAQNLRNNVSIDPHMPVGAAQFRIPYILSSYRHDAMGSWMTGASIPISANYNHYGQVLDAHYEVPATLSTAISITLMHTIGATGNELPPTGARVHIHRQNGTYANAVSIFDSGNGTAIATLTTAYSDAFARFNGTNWVTFTPVT